jgi:hypothetical protein
MCKVRTYFKTSHELFKKERTLLVFLPMLEHMQMVSNSDVAFSCKHCSNNGHKWPCLPLINHKWQLGTPSTGDLLETFSHIMSPYTSLLLRIKINLQLYIDAKL